MAEETLLNILLENPTGFVSGEEMSRRLSISRTAVWKQINKLRTLGYEFEAVPNKGYRILMKPDTLDKLTLTNALNTVVMGSDLEIIKTTVSTQEEARQRAELGAPEGTVIIAEEQTGGKGRLGRKWFSPYGKGIWMSLVLRPQQSLEYTSQLTLLSGVAVCRAIRKTTGLDVGIKWPNDILMNQRKVCGILLESTVEDKVVRYCIAGIGISVNVDSAEYPEDLRDIATSLKAESGGIVDRTLLIAAVLEEFETLYQLYAQEGFLPIASLWEALSVTINHEVVFNTTQGLREGLAVGLDPSGALLVDTGMGNIVPVISGDVKLK
ncbi:biotin--[acetyl-CoA-carboxylase] ligase [Paenibacillus macquariensis]|uniref:biotin--[acetyl-CoA-carboxylase] ligase n=1 Tax=Paenibacillus macquariensis TaxID=948756 RepID=UPI0007C24A59|nr:biotin--[acetyl-CoA-carboxylase] ligase [Paenibacillus macquariensis]MEC0089727.1 biotin--[acetyl-CoA-carboxylase] ligase [Paenibacillus macquariensis]OAB30794.1 bifunctional biotin--[acetyl-CoA-carboxylase] synthetase/biotin operon repressor [Paenibacillus macquariensis subsp. macquariensis]